MHTELYSGSLDTLIDWCQSEETLMRYSEYLRSELEHVADATLVIHLRKLQALCGDMFLNGGQGGNSANNDSPIFDSLLTDIFSVASYMGWKHPMHLDQREHEIAEQDLPLAAGLLGFDDAEQGAQLYVLDSTHLVLARNREAGAEVNEGSFP